MVSIFLLSKKIMGDNDKSSELDRPGIYRLRIGISKESYDRQFCPRPKRPCKGSIVGTGHHSAEVNVLMSNPIYECMSWMHVLSPEKSIFESIFPLIAEAYSNSVT
jgi:hypothetical protein